jgi:hypothetical protein
MEGPLNLVDMKAFLLGGRHHESGQTGSGEAAGRPPEKQGAQGPTLEWLQSKPLMEEIGGESVDFLVTGLKETKPGIQM